MDAAVEDIGGGHIIREKADVYFRRDKSHGDIVGDFINRNCGILVHLSSDTVKKAVLQPLPGFWTADVGAGGAITLKGCVVNAGMECGIVGARVIQEQGVELFQGSDIIQFQSVEPALLEGAEVALHLGLACPVPDLSMERDGSQRTTDQGKPLIGVGSPVIHIELHRDTIGGNGGLEYLLEVVRGIVIEKPTSNQESGMVIYDHDAEYTPTPAILSDMRQIAGIRLP